MGQQQQQQTQGVGTATAHAPVVMLVLSAPTKTVRAHVRGLVERLAAGGARVRLAAPEHVLAGFADIVDVALHGTALALGDDLRPGHDVAAVRTLRAALRRCGVDVVHSHGLRAGVVAGLAARSLARRPAVVTTWHALPYTDGGRRVSIGLGERVAARTSDVTLAPSTEVLDHARRVGARRARLSPVAAPEAAPLHADRLQLRRRLAVELGLREDAPWLLTVGRLVPQKNHDMLLAAAQRWRRLHPSPEVLVVGVGAAAVVSRIRRQVQDEGLHVRLLGARDDMVELLAACDVFVLTSRWEAPAIPVQEAMRAGLAVVSTAVGGIPELVDGTAVLVEPDDVEGFALAIVELLADPARAASLSRAARARAATLPGEDEVATDVRAAYDEALSACRRC